jgi:FtsZ-interacting cell division protein YlmF
MIPDDFDDEPVEVRMTIAVPEPTITMTVDEQKIAQTTHQLVEQARAVLVTDPASYQDAGRMIDALKVKKRDVVGWFAPMVDAAHSAWKTLTAKRATLTDPLDEAITVLSSRYATFAQQERARADAERRRLEREAQERERARLQAEANARAQEADRARAAGFANQADELAAEAAQTRIEAANVQAPVLPSQSRIADIKGPSVVARWTYEITDKAALIAAVARGDVSIEAVNPNTVYLGQFAESNKNTRPMPGVRFFDAGSVRASRRR